MKKRYKKEGISRLLKMKADELGRMPKKREINDDPRLPSSETYRKYIGNLPELAKEMGYKSWRGARRKEILKKVGEMGRKLGRMPTYMEMRKSDENMPSPRLVIKYFGSSNNLREKLGLQTQKRLIYSDEELLRRLRLRAEELGKAPTMKEVESAPSLPSINTYVKRFGSLGRALERIDWKKKRKHWKKR